MLVLTRKAGETITIGDDVRLVVLEVRGDQVRLGVDAPRKVAVHRGEVYDAIQRANREAGELPNLPALGKMLKGTEE